MTDGKREEVRLKVKEKGDTEREGGGTIRNKKGEKGLREEEKDIQNVRGKTREGEERQRKE
jgi:hypothetical protein